MDRGHFDRRDQLRHHRRQSARRPGCEATEFWELVSAKNTPWVHWTNLFRSATARGIINQYAAGEVLVNGVPGFFKPRFPPPPLRPNGTAAARAGTIRAPLLSTLERLVDFDRINAKRDAFQCRCGQHTHRQLRLFRQRQRYDPARARHGQRRIAAGVPAVEIEGEFYWDGGLVSNTPLDWVLSAPSELDTLVLQVDLWSARGACLATSPRSRYG